MNCTKAEKQILLAASGELAPAGRRALCAHLDGCARCRAYRADVAALERAGLAVLPSHSVAPATVAGIRAAACVPAPVPRLLFRHPLAEALACAAGLALLIWGGLIYGATARAQRIGEISAAIAILSATGAETAASAAPLDPEADIRALAQRLLELQGFANEDLMDAATAELPPTALQSRSSPGSPARRCG